MKARIHNSVLRSLLIIGALFLGVACNNQESSPSKNAPADSMTSQSGSRVDTVIIKLMKFHPADIHVSKGDTIVWINKDIVAHNVTEYPDKTWTSDTIARTHSWKKEIDEGFNYFCSIHPTMRGKVTVNP